MKKYEYDWLIASTMGALMVKIKRLDPNCRVISVCYNCDKDIYIAVIERVIGND